MPINGRERSSLKQICFRVCTCIVCMFVECLIVNGFNAFIELTIG